MPTIRLTTILAMLMLVGCSDDDGATSGSGSGTTTTVVPTNGHPVHLLRFQADGSLEAGTPDIEKILQEFGEEPPSDVFILAHGWNNNDSIAIDELYRPMVDRMKTVADQQDLRRDDYHPLIIGLRWPSMAWPDEAVPARAFFAAGDEQESTPPPALPEEVDRILQINFPNASDQERAAVKDFASKKTPTKEEYNAVIKIMSKNLQPLEAGESTGPAERVALLEASSDQPEPAGAVSSLRTRLRDPRDLLRVFTYWQMKRRAGVVGENGLQPALKTLQERFKDAEIHLVGHSFGAKLVLSACRKDQKYALNQPIKTIVLLQGAISHESFSASPTASSSPGGYHSAFFKDGKPANAGLIVATFSDADRPLRLAYPLASRLAGQGAAAEAAVANADSAEDAVSRYSAIGGVGVRGLGSEFVRNIAMTTYIAEEPAAYGFKESSGPFYSVNGKNADGVYYINGHSDFHNLDTAWLIWSAILRK